MKLNQKGENMQNNAKRNDANDILEIIKSMDNNGELITAPAIAKYVGQTASNVHRIIKIFKIDLKPYQKKFRENKIKKILKEFNQKQKKTVDCLKNIDTASYNLSELLKITNFQGTEKQLKDILINHKMAFKTKSWFAQHLKRVETQEMTLRELYKECKLQENDITFATFRTRLYENAIPYKQIITRKNWWQNLSGIDKKVPQKAIDELYSYFKENNVNSEEYTIKELYGYFDFNMPYLAFKHLILTQEIKTKFVPPQ